MKKTIVFASLICVILASFAFIKKDDAPKYENLKVLPKDTDKHAMDSIMRHFSSSLGVRCTFCHVRNSDGMKDFNFASDDNKNKNVAREMYKMTAKINKKYFKEEGEGHDANQISGLTCYSCHHGKEHPETMAPAGPPPPPPAPHN